MTAAGLLVGADEEDLVIRCIRGVGAIPEASFDHGPQPGAPEIGLEDRPRGALVGSAGEQNRPAVERDRWGSRGIQVARENPNAVCVSFE
jgi:hypothetical protein